MIWGEKNYYELAGGSSYRAFELPKVKITLNFELNWNIEFEFPIDVM